MTNQNNKINNIECKQIIDLYNNLKANRSSLEKLWEQIIIYVRPQKNPNPNGGRDIYDSTAVLCADNLTSGLWSLMNSKSSSWFYVKENIQDYNNNMKNVDNVQWLRDVDKILKDNLSSNESGFYHKSYEFYADLVCFGTGIFHLSEDTKNNKVIFQPINILDTYLHKTSDNIDLVIRKLLLNASEAVNLFGYENLYKSIQDAYDNKHDDIFTILHCVCPHGYFNNNDKNLNNMEYSSYYIDLDNNYIIAKSGYYEFPFMISRWTSNSNQLYGQSPAMCVLADIKMLNAMSKTMLVSAQRMVDPPILAPSEGALEGMKTVPGSIIYGGIDSASGNQLVKPLHLDIDMANTHILQEQRRQSIKDAFYNSLLLFMYSKNATATEVISTNEQKIRILGAKIARIQSEFLYPLIKRQYQILKRLNIIPPSDIDGDIKIEFAGEWNKQMQLMNNVSIDRLTSFIHSIKELYPDIKNDINWKEILHMAAENNNIPTNIFYKSKE